MLKAAARLLMPNSKMGYELPAEHWFQFVKESTRYTPDVAKLEEYEFQLFFACEETQRGHTKHDFIKDGSYLCPAFTQTSFNYWRPEEPWIPVIPMEATGYANPLTNLPPIAKIKGEIHAIRPQAILKLDIEKQNTVQFIRRRVRLIIPHRMLKHIHDYNLPPVDVEFMQGNLGLTFEKLCVIRAWMYIGVPEYWDKLISTFDYHSVGTFQSKNRSWCREYYQLRR